jgi:type II secretory pathway predicted ATPase ExeA
LRCRSAHLIAGVGFKALLKRRFSHLETSLCRPVLHIDEAKEMTQQVLSELRLLASVRFDS